jgi:hypothetical protein
MSDRSGRAPRLWVSTPHGGLLVPNKTDNPNDKPIPNNPQGEREQPGEARMVEDRKPETEQPTQAQREYKPPSERPDR